MNTTFFTCFRAEINSRTYYKKSLFEIYRKKELFVQEAMFNLKCSSASYSWSWSFKIASSLEWANFLNFTLKVGFAFPEWDVYNSVSSSGKLEIVEVYTQVRFAGNIKMIALWNVQFFRLEFQVCQSWSFVLLMVPLV